MTTPTIPQVESWKPQTLVAAGKAIITAGDDLNDRMAEVDLAVDKATLNWKGEAGAAASMRSVSELLTASQAKRATASIGDAVVFQAEAIDAYRAAIINMRDIAVNAHGMTVAPDGTVTAPAVPGDDDDAFRPTVQGRLDRQAADFQTSLKENLNNCATALNALKFAAALGLTDLDQHGGPGGATVGANTLTGADGNKLGTQIQDAVANNKPIPQEVLDQLTEDLKATGLPPDQLQAYLNGETATIPASTQQYLTELYKSAGADGFTSASQQLQSQGPAGQQAAASLANGVMIVSNEKVGTGRDANGKLTGAGNYENLPQDMRDLISTRPAPAGSAPDANATMYPGDSTIVNNHKDFVNSQKDLFQALSLAEQGNQPGTKMSTELIRQGAHTAWLEGHGGGVPFSTDPSNDPTKIEPLENAIALGSRNLDGVHAIFTGQGGPDILGEGYKPDTALMPLLQRDDGTAMGSLTDWIPRDAHTTAPEGTQDQQDSKRAGEAARGLAEIMSTTKSSDGTNNYTTLLSGPGKIGDGTADQVAEALAPYVGDMAGMPDDLTQTHGFGEFGGGNEGLGGPIGPLRVFSILDSDNEASQIINGTALAESQRMDRLFATTGEPGLGTHAYRLQWLVEHGLKTEMDQRVQEGVDQKAAETSRNSKFNSAWTASQIIAGGATGPYAPLAVGVAAGTELLKPFVLTTDDIAVPKPRNITLDTSEFNFDSQYRPSDWGSPSYREYSVFNALVNSGSIDLGDVPTVYKNEEGTGLVPFSDTERRFIQLNNTELQNEARTAVGELIVGAGVHNLSEYSSLATGDTQRNILAEIIRPESNSASREDILKWIASSESSSSNDNKWPTRVV